VSDAERTEVAEALSEHYADGRLDSTEFKERLDQAMAAKTRGDLAGLMTDLPALRTSAPPPPRRRWGSHMILWVAVAVAAVAWWAPWPDYHGSYMPHVPWLLVLVGIAFVWRRAGWRHRHRSPSASGPSA
jgi:hypothetical protein